MKRTLSFAVLVVLFLVSPSVAADAPPETPKVSSFAPAADLAGQVPEYLNDLAKAVKDEAEYKDGKEKLVKDANTLIVIALALGMHDEENAYKKAAPAMIREAQKLAAAEDYAAAKAGVDAVTKAAASADGGPLAWEKVASLRALMEAVPTINTAMKRYTRGSRLKRMAKKSTGGAAVLAAIAQGSLPHVADTRQPGEAARWYAECIEMRTAAAEVGAAVRAGDEAATAKAMERLNKSCDTCHEVFHPEEK